MNVFKVSGVYFLNLCVWYYRKTFNSFELFSDFFYSARSENHNDYAMRKDGEINGII